MNHVAAPVLAQGLDLLERISDGFVAFDAQMNYTVNQKGAETLGRKPEDLIGKITGWNFPKPKARPSRKPTSKP
jgi:hypothetical protein